MIPLVLDKAFYFYHEQGRQDYNPSRMMGVVPLSYCYLFPCCCSLGLKNAL